MAVTPLTVADAAMALAFHRGFAQLRLMIETKASER